MFVPDRGPKYSKEDAAAAIADSRSWAEALRKLGMCASGGSNVVLRKYAHIWGISTEHVDPYAALRERPGPRKIPLGQILVADSTYSRSNLKARLYEEGLKQRRCEFCGQGEDWNGRRMSLIIDHVNGVSNDNRIENLRILCPNCAATLDTHCGRNARVVYEDRACLRCGAAFTPNYANHRYCTRDCGRRRPGATYPSRRRAERPPVDELVAAIGREGYEAVGRRYGVSGNAIRKWVRAAGAVPPPGSTPTPPSRRLLDDNAARQALQLIADGLSDAQIGARFGVSRWCIRDLRRGRTHRHIPRPIGRRAA